MKSDNENLFQKYGIGSVDYKDTEHYIVTKRFVDAPEKMVEELGE